ncbi:MAG: glycerophosphodiester phosphodiesterase [Deltaproteobacteria bacterium]|nr:glycerophosphodiester phosphodiesterase [Deltaproteobacteria bacterium]
MAHRGDTETAVENTLEAIDSALKLGADGVEVDVRLSADGVPFLYHDENFERLTGRGGRIEGRTAEEIKKIRLGGRYKIPTLEEACDLVKGRGLFNIELKCSLINSIQLSNSIGSIISKYDSEQFLISSFNPLPLFYFKKKFSSVRCGLLFWEGMSLPGRNAWVRHCLRPSSLHLSLRLATKERVEAFKKEGYRIFVWTVNEENDIERALSMDLTGIITDHPRKVLERIDRKK